MSTLTKAKEVYYEEGGLPLMRRGIRFVYDSYLRPRFPKQTVMYNSVPVRAAHLGDSIVPQHTMDIPGYEDALVHGIRKYVKDGNSVVIVGGGWGVATVVAAEEVGATGCVITFEGSKDAVENVEETLHLNDVAKTTTVRHAVVGQAISLRGEQGAAAIIAPSELPECDVLVLDCEGAEMDILEQMEIEPRALIVETHAIFDAPEVEVRANLIDRGYHVSGEVVAEERLREVCEEKGIYVLYADRR